jgi:5-methylthioadenosine/S-adenosylhomocysteine deaminase
LGENILAAHCIHLSKEDMETMATYKVKVSYNPIANMKIAVDIPRINGLIALVVIVGIGTDGPTSNNSLDMFESIKVAALLQKVFYIDLTILPAKSVLEMSTIKGAEVLGLQKKVGSLELGKQADIILIDFKKPHLTPTHDLNANIVYSTRGSDEILSSWMGSY